MQQTHSVNSSRNPLSQKEIDALYARREALEGALKAAMGTVRLVKIPEGASAVEIKNLQNIQVRQVDEVADPFLQAYHDWERSLSIRELSAVGLGEMTPELEAYIEEHVADVCGA